MSLATAGGGLGGMGGAGAAGGGLVMAHPANAMARPAAPNPPPGSANVPPGMAPPSTAAAALGADLVDKQQQLSLQQVRDLSRMPLVAVDLYASEPHVASFPPKPKDPAEVVEPSLVGKMADKVLLKASDGSHKTFRKWLSQTKGYADLKADVLAKMDDKSAVVVESPQRWLGLRRLQDAPASIRGKVSEDESASPAIAEEASQGVGVTMANGTLDGSVPQGDDFDRVVCKVRLHASKKALTVLPEEMTGLLFNQAQHHVSRKVEVEDEEDIVNYPCCVAVPSVYCTDSSIEALLEATGGTGVVLQRSLCALAGAFLPSKDKNKGNILIEHTNGILKEMHSEYQKALVKNPDATYDEEMIVLVAGLSKDTVECAAIQISSPSATNYNCIWGNFKVLTNVSYRHEKPETIVDKCISDMFDTLDTMAPDAEMPVAMISYGTAEEQKTIHAKWEKLKKSLEDWEDVKHFYTKTDAVAMGTAVLGAVSHGRLSKVVQVPGKKAKAQLAIQIQNVSPVAVGVMMNYHGGAKDKWLPVKTVFDFDRRVPAGPYQLDLVAAECAVYRDGKVNLSEEDLLKAIKDNEGAKCIPKREEAALNLRVHVVQKWTRDGEWKKIGDVMSPLVTLDKEEKRIACEQVFLELSLGATGMITNALVGERESVVHANTSARNSTIRWYVGVALAILFFGGFLVKSWWEERVFERDTRRLLAFYKHVIPGSLSDGDLHNARYVVWKYRNKKEKLWKSLEKKYGEPVLHEYEWPEVEPEETEPEAEENLDEDEGDADSQQDL